MIRSTEKGGKVTDKAAQNILIRVYGRYSSYVTRTAPDGSFAIKLLVGKWNVYAFANGYVMDGGTARTVVVTEARDTLLSPPIVLTAQAETAAPKPKR